MNPFINLIEYNIWIFIISPKNWNVNYIRFKMIKDLILPNLLYIYDAVKDAIIPPKKKNIVIYYKISSYLD